MTKNTSLWAEGASAPVHPALTANIEMDVVVIGGGITGVTAALMLARAGKRVILLEARRIDSGVSHRSTAHLTEAVDARYAQIESDFGKEGAKLVAQSSRAAIETIAELTATLSLPCGLVRRPGYLFTEVEKDGGLLRKEHEAASRAGLAVEWVSEAPLPFPTRAALRFPEQGQMHVMRYLSGLAAAAGAHGSALPGMSSTTGPCSPIALCAEVLWL